MSASYCRYFIWCYYDFYSFVFDLYHIHIILMRGSSKDVLFLVSYIAIEFIVSVSVYDDYLISVQ